VDRPADKVRAAIHSINRSTNRAATARPSTHGQGTAAALGPHLAFPPPNAVRSFFPAQHLRSAAVTY
jgi:hypothetical protein